jgi:hypothetical protein
VNIINKLEIIKDKFKKNDRLLAIVNSIIFSIEEEYTQ